VSDTYDYQIFLVSNKHALPRESNRREGVSEITLHCNIRGPNGKTLGEAVPLPLHFDNGCRIWREHRDSDVDMMAFDVTSLIVEGKMPWRFAAYLDFVDKEKLEEMDITIADDVFVIGYPSGLTQGTANLPIVRSGIIATRIGEPFVDEVEEDRVIRPRTVRGFLIDGATIPGSSGSPVVLKPEWGRGAKATYHTTTYTDKRAPALLLRIVAETLYASVKTRYQDIVSFAGLGLAFDAQTIKETIALFF